MLQRVVLNYFRLFIVIVSFVWNQTATAHHSRSNFDLERTVSLYGVVKDFTFRNPHAWIDLAVEVDGKSVAYTIEGGSVGSLRRLGWDQKSLSIGDRVTIIANPDNDPDRRYAYLIEVTMASGERLAGTAGATRSRAVEQNASPVEPSTDFSGVWTRVVDEKYFNVDAFSKPTHWPLNKSGREMIANYDKNDDPAFECIALAMPRIAYAPFRHRWERVGDQLKISKELSPFIREIDLGVKNWPDQMGASRLGTSIGWIETDGSLEIMTQGFPPEKWGLYRGLDSSAGKEVTEVYRLKNNGLGMELTLTVWDPAYLSEPHTEVWKFKKVPDGEVAFSGFDCDLQSARRHLLVERVIDNDTVSSSAHTQNSENSPRRYPFHLIFGVCVFAAGVVWLLLRRR